MSEAAETYQMKAYNVFSAIEFLEERFPEKAEEVKRKFSGRLHADLDRVGRFDFVPRAHLSEVTTAIADLEGDPDARFQLITELGGYIAHGATNTFLRLLMRMMTPQLFASRADAIWKKDNRGGYVEVDTSELASGKLGMTFKEMDGFAYYRAICVGWMDFAFQRMGAKNVRISHPPGEDVHAVYSHSVSVLIEWG